MTVFNPDDVTEVSTRLADGSRHIRLKHEPTGLTVEANAGDQPISKVLCRLFDELKDKVTKNDGQ
jgi:hypothetical protein